MANEAVIIELGPNGGAPVRRLVAATLNISKGTLLTLNDANRVSGSAITTQDGFAFGGVAAEDHLAAESKTYISAYTEGVFDMTTTANTGIDAGDVVIMSGANLIMEGAAGHLLTGGIVGKAEETAGASEVIRVRLIGY